MKGNYKATPRGPAGHDPSKISHHTHRVGHHFRNDIVETASVQTGLTITSRGIRPTESRGTGLAPEAMARRLQTHGQKLGFSTDESDPKKQRETVFVAIRDLFPKIPEDDQRAIVDRAFQEVHSPRMQCITII